MKNLSRLFAKKIIILALTVVTIDAHAARPRAVSPEEAKYFSFDQDVIVQDYINSKGNPANITFTKCIYRLTNVDKSGEYYTGEEGCFQLVNWQDDKSSQNGQGGILIPTNPRKKPRLYMVVDTPKETCGALGFLICRLSMLENGRFKLMPGKVKPEAVMQINIVSGSP